MLVLRCALVALACGLVTPPVARAAFRGDPAAAAEVRVLEAPPACCFGTWAGVLRGSVTHVDPAEVAVVVYAHTDLFYLQPYVDSTLEVDALGRWGTDVRGGTDYLALLVRRGFAPAATLPAIPEVGGEVLALANAPRDQRRIEFAGLEWIAKSSGGAPFGPGPNVWTDDPQSIWVDALGALHLRLAPRDGIWPAVEVYTERALGYGQYRFDVEGPIDRLDPNVVFAGFLYADSGSELDVEWTRWGDGESRTNAQFSLPPDRVERVAVDLAGEPSASTIRWLPERVDFEVRAGTGSGGGAPLASWTVAGEVPPAEGARMRFNLWLVGGGAPGDGQVVEVVVDRFSLDAPTDVASTLGDNKTPVLRAPYAAGGARLRYTVDLAAAAPLVVELLDVRGRRVATLFDGVLAGGSHPLGWEPGVLAPARGVYLLAARSGAQRTVRKLVWLHE